MLGTQVSGRIMRPADDGRYLMVARPENLGLRPAASPEGSAVEGELTGRVHSLQFQGYRTSYHVALPGGRNCRWKPSVKMAPPPSDAVTRWL
ncbi:TOBE domain-containing protein [Sulfitobacter porphyrae]|uniref:TOBE domain-containing protein n=1 Tax=Sulfitobacter porphyrae TaxID=1246864 RepID=A0ABW2B8X6_9RHOB